MRAHPHLLACVAVALLSTALLGAGFEAPPTLTASDVVPADLRRGDGFHVDDVVPTDGLTTRLKLVSDVGTFEVHGVATSRSAGSSPGSSASTPTPRTPRCRRSSTSSRRWPSTAAWA